MDPSERVQLVLMIVGTVGTVLGVAVPLLIWHLELWSRINRLQERIGSFGIDHQKTLIVRDAKIVDLEGARAILIKKARHDTDKFRALDRRLRILETELVGQISPLVRRE
jgi:hypothetical protein